MLNTAPQIQYSAILDFIYPVGSYFITESSDYNTVAKVQAHFGGTWVQVTGRFLYGSATAGITDGEATHTLTIEEMPSHSHVENEAGPNWTGPKVMVSGNQGSGSYEGNQVKGSYITNGLWVISTQPSGGSQAHNNMPPYRTVYMYRRTA